MLWIVKFSNLYINPEDLRINFEIKDTRSVAEFFM